MNFWGGEYAVEAIYQGLITWRRPPSTLSSITSLFWAIDYESGSRVPEDDTLHLERSTRPLVAGRGESYPSLNRYFDPMLRTGAFLLNHMSIRALRLFNDGELFGTEIRNIVVARAN